MATISARGAASVSSLGPMNGDGDTRDHLNFSTPAGWHLTIWMLSVLVIAFFLWAL